MAKDDFTAFLGVGAEYQGKLTFKGTVRTDCLFLGDIISDGKLILGKEAHLKGTVRVRELVVHGTLDGDAVVTGLTILHQDAKVAGTLCTAKLVIEEGALLQGELLMGEAAVKNSEAARNSAAARKSEAENDPARRLSAQPEHNVPLFDASVEQ